MRIALADLQLDALYVVYPGDRRYRLGERVEAVPLGARDLRHPLQGSEGRESGRAEQPGKSPASDAGSIPEGHTRIEPRGQIGGIVHDRPESQE